jgi:aminoglycoside phosphotransferase (APT) family kinase protein
VTARGVTAETGRHSGDDPAPDVVDWIASVTGAIAVRAERAGGGASRIGHRIDATLADGSVRLLWLRSDTGVGPQSATTFTLRREAAVYRALGPTPVPAPPFVAVHPTEEMFLTERIDGRTWFSELTDPAERTAIASEFMGHVAALHALDPSTLDLPELGTPSTVSAHVHDELDEWEGQSRAHGGDDDPLLVLAFAWFRQRIPADGDWSVVVVQGDTGPGNFMYRDGRVAAITDWEMAHLGDRHDDLGWICVRDLQERFTHLPDRWGDYERASGVRVDHDRLRWFRAFAQLRCTIGTRNGLLAHDSRVELANLLIYHTLHERLLAELMADLVGVEDAEAVAADAAAALGDPPDTDDAWVFDAALEDLRTVVVPAIADPFAARRAKGVARLLKHLRERDRLGDVVDRADADDLRALVPDDPTRAGLAAAIRAGSIADAAAVRYCLRHVARTTRILRPAMGELADRHHSPIR